MKFHDAQAAGYFRFKRQRIFYKWEFLSLDGGAGRGEGKVEKRCKEKFHICALSALLVYMDEPNFLGFLEKMGLLH